MTRICAHGEIMLRSRTQEKEIPHGRWLMHEHDLAHDLPGALLMSAGFAAHATGRRVSWGGSRSRSCPQIIFREKFCSFHELYGSCGSKIPHAGALLMHA